MMTTGKIIQFATPGCDDADLIVDAVREGFSAHLLELMIYGSHGICKFVREQIALQNVGGDVHYTIARCDGRFAGAAEFRRIPEGLFLNYIAIMPAYRDRGLGSRLLREALDQHGTSEHAAIVLDVLDHNIAARRWYDRLGFCDERLTQWWTFSLVPTGLGDCPSIEGYPQAQACQREYGFSRFQLNLSRTQYEIGRLGEKWYRISDPAAMNEPGLFDQLCRLDAHRQLLLLAPDSWSPTSVGKLVAQTRRLRAPLGLVRESLDRLIDRSAAKECNQLTTQKRVSA